MKEKFTLTLMDMPVSIVSDEGEETVRALAAALNDRLEKLLWKSKQISKTEAALFCALDCLGEAQSVKKRLERAEAQLDVYAGNLARLTAENERLSQKVDELEARQKRK